MRIGTVIGTVTLSNRHESLVGGSYRLVCRCRSTISPASRKTGEELVVYDELGRGRGA